MFLTLLNIVSYHFWNIINASWKGIKAVRNAQKPTTSLLVFPKYASPILYIPYFKPSPLDTQMIKNAMLYPYIYSNTYYM